MAASRAFPPAVLLMTVTAPRPPGLPFFVAPARVQEAENQLPELRETGQLPECRHVREVRAGPEAQRQLPELFQAPQHLECEKYFRGRRLGEN